jgi:hypothetical protein
MANPEIAIDDDEIAALLDELEAETGGAAPAAAPAPAPAPKVAEPEPEVAPKPEPEPQPVAEPEPTPAPVKAKAVAKAKPEPVNEAPVATAPAPAPADFADVADASELSEDVPKTAAAKLQYFVDVNQFNRDTKLTEATLDSAMMEQASLRAYYGTMAANAEAQHARLKVRFDVLEAKLYDEARKSLAAGGEKVTEKMVENAVKLDPRWLKAKNAVIEADTIANINKGLVASLGDRRDMMIQMGADRREGYKGAMRVMEAKNEAESLGARAKAAFQNARPQ